MTINEMEIIERTAQAKCGSSYVITLDPLKAVMGEKYIVIRIQPKSNPDTIIPCVLTADSTLSEICELTEALIEDIKDIVDM